MTGPIIVKFEGIDYWNRPIFKSTTGDARYGSTEKLYGYLDGVKNGKIREEITADDLVYFGREFDCEPLGTLPVNKLEIDWSEMDPKNK